MHRDEAQVAVDEYEGFASSLKRFASKWSVVLLAMLIIEFIRQKASNSG